MTSDEVLDVLGSLKDPRLLPHVELLRKALAASDRRMTESSRAVESIVLLEIYRARLQLAAGRNNPTDVLQALVDMFAAGTGETWTLIAVSGGGIDGGVFVSLSGRAGCLASRKVADGGV